MTHPWLLVALITALALAIRLAGLGGKSLWIDEAHSYYFASHTFPNIFNRLCDPHPPGYYALLRVFLTWGQNEFWLRLPSAIAGTLTVPLLYPFGRALDATLRTPWLDRRTTLLAALLLAVAPLHVWYSREARMYALVTTLGLGAVYLALRFAQSGRARDALGYVLIATLALYVDQSSGLPLLLANLLWGWLWLRRRRPGTKSSRRKLVIWIGLQLLTGAAFGLWWSQAKFLSRFENGTFYQLTMVQQVLDRLVGQATPVGLQWALAIGALVVLGLVAWIGWGAVQHRWPLERSAVLAEGIVALFVLLTIASAVPRLFTLKRLLLSLLPFVLLATAWAMHRLQLGRRALFASLAFSLALCMVNVWFVPREPWREIVAVVAQEIGPNDELWVDELAVPVFDYYAGGSHERRVWRAAQLLELGHTQQAGQPNPAGAKRLWVIAMADDYRNLLDFVPASWQSVWGGDWHRVRVRAYALPLPDAAPERDLPDWLLAWPSPLDQACQE